MLVLNTLTRGRILMATKIYCDCCGQQITRGHIGREFKVPLHITEPFPAYQDMEGNGTSGRFVEYDLCLKCSNEVYDAAHKCIEAIRERDKK
jgi:hypothetical protein